MAKIERNMRELNLKAVLVALSLSSSLLASGLSTLPLSLALNLLKDLELLSI